MYRYILILFIFVFSETLFSQDVQEEWVDIALGYSGIDIQLDENNNVYVLTATFSLIKYDMNGNELWNVTYEESTGGEAAVDFKIDYDNNICITGYKNGIDAWNDIVTVKFDSNGNQLWDMVYQSPSWAEESKPVGLDTDNSGNIYVTGYSRYTTESTGYSRGVTIKYDQDGNEEWISLYEPIYDNWLATTAMMVDDFGAVYVIGGDGLKSGQIVSLHRYIIIKYDSDGQILWENFCSAPNGYTASAKALTIDSAHNIYVTGNFYDEEGPKILTIKYNESGDWLWDTSTAPFFGFYPTHIATDFDHNTILTIEGLNSNHLVKYNPSGFELWSTSTFHSKDIFVDQNGSIYLSGNLNFDYATSKYSPNGSQEWLIEYNGVFNFHDYSEAITLDDFGNVYITGKSYSENYDVVCNTIKYSQLTSVNDELFFIQENQISNFPNPFNPWTIFEFSIQNDSHVEITVYNIKGQIIKTLVHENFIKGNHSLIWNGDNNNNESVSSGIYYYKLNVNGKTEAVRKCLLLK